MANLSPSKMLKEATGRRPDRQYRYPIGYRCRPHDGRGLAGGCIEHPFILAIRARRRLTYVRKSFPGLWV